MELDKRYTDIEEDDYYHNTKDESHKKDLLSDLEKCVQGIKDVFRYSAIQKVTRDIEQLCWDIVTPNKFDINWKNTISIRQNFSPINYSTMGIAEQPTTFDGGNNDRETSLPKEEDLSYLDCCDVWDDSHHVLNRKLRNARIYLNDLIIGKNKLKPNSGKEAEFLEEIDAIRWTIKEINFELLSNQTFGALPQINTREKLDRILYAKFGWNFIYRIASITWINPFWSQNWNWSVQTTEWRNWSDASALKNWEHRSTNDHLIDDSTINKLNLTHITEIEAEKKMAAVNTLKEKYKKKVYPYLLRISEFNLSSTCIVARDSFQRVVNETQTQYQREVRKINWWPEQEENTSEIETAKQELDKKPSGEQSPQELTLRYNYLAKKIPILKWYYETGKITKEYFELIGIPWCISEMIEIKKLENLELEQAWEKENKTGQETQVLRRKLYQNSNIIEQLPWELDRIKKEKIKKLHEKKIIEENRKHKDSFYDFIRKFEEEKVNKRTILEKLKVILCEKDFEFIDAFENFFIEVKNEWLDIDVPMLKEMMLIWAKESTQSTGYIELMKHCHLPVVEKQNIPQINSDISNKWKRTPKIPKFPSMRAAPGRYG